MSVQGALAHAERWQPPEKVDRSRYQGLLDSGDFMARMRPPSYIVSGVVQRGSLYTLTGRTGHGKTAAALAMALSVATGSPFSGREVRKGSVLFLAGENAENVRVMWFGLCADRGVDPASVPVHWHDGSFLIEAAADRLTDDAARIHDLTLVVADTLQAFFAGDDDNSNVQMLAAARSFRALSELPSRPTVIVPAHPVKNAGRDSLLPRGGSSFLNEIDGNLTLWREGQIARLHWQGKLRGPTFDPLGFEMVPTLPPGLVDEDGRQMPCTVARDLLVLREEELTKDAISKENRALEAIRTNPEISVSGLAECICTSKSTAGRLMARLRDLRWVKKRGRKHVLTPEGEEVLDG